MFLKFTQLFIPYVVNQNNQMQQNEFSLIWTKGTLDSFYIVFSPKRVIRPDPSIGKSRLHRLPILNIGRR